VNRDLTPTEGVRLLLERQREDAAGAVYTAAIYTPSASYEGLATLGEDGSVAISVEAPADLVEMLTMAARLLARGAAGRREEGLPAWPARILRWRGPGRGQ
jgi:hypothetical protein